MFSISDLLALIDAYKTAAGVQKDQTVSSRIFGDSAKVAQLRADRDLTTRRFNMALHWLQANWPEGHEMPEKLAGLTMCSDAAE